jgi:hypothetical protein
MQSSCGQMWKQTFNSIDTTSLCRKHFELHDQPVRRSCETLWPRIAQRPKSTCYECGLPRDIGALV